MLRKSTYIQAGGYRPEFYFAQDVDLWSRMIDRAGYFALAEVLYEARFDLGGITARHRSEQEALRSLVEQAARARRLGQSEFPILAKAAVIRPSSTKPARKKGDVQLSEAAYFVGSCLAQQNDPRARKYFIDAVRRNPAHLKSWVKLARAWASTR